MSSSLLTAAVGANCGNVYITTGPAWITDNAIYAVTTPGSVPLEFFRLVFEAVDLRQQAGGSGQPFVNQGTLDGTPIPLPSLEEIREILGAASVASRCREVLATRMAELEGVIPQLDASILAKAFRGQLVPQDPSDEPASVLLERIRKEREGVAAKKRTRKVKPQ